MSLAAEADAALARVWGAEKQLETVRREASKAFKAAGRDTEAMFSESTFVLRKTAEKWIAEAKQESVPIPRTSGISPSIHLAMSGSGERPKPSFKEEMAMRRAGTWTEPAPKSEDIAAKFANATAEERARMICEAAERHRPLKGK